jgi:hypothetical protein
MKKRMLELMSGFVMLALISCATTGAVNEDTVETQPSLIDYTDYSAVIYTGDMGRTLNMSVPNNPDEAVQCILYLCDDVLMAADNKYIQSLETLKNTYLIAATSYQFSPEKLRVKDAIVDMDDIISHIKTTAAEHSVAIKKLILVGHSSTSNRISMYIF